MKRTPIVAALVALALPGLASAKDIRSFSVCGPSACHESAAGDDRVRAAWAAFGGGPGGGLPAVPGAKRGDRYYTLGVKIRGDDRADERFSVALWYVEPDLVQWVDTPSQPFRRLSPTVAALMQELARGVEPFRAPGGGGTPWAVRVGIGVLVACLAAGTLVFLARRRPRPEAGPTPA